jgi:hypothetical protein
VTSAPSHTSRHATGVVRENLVDHREEHGDRHHEAHRRIPAACPKRPRAPGMDITEVKRSRAERTRGEDQARPAAGSRHAQHHAEGEEPDPQRTPRCRWSWEAWPSRWCFIESCSWVEDAGGTEDQGRNSTMVAMTPTAAAPGSMLAANLLKAPWRRTVSESAPASWPFTSPLTAAPQPRRTKSRDPQRRISTRRREREERVVTRARSRPACWPCPLSQRVTVSSFGPAWPHVPKCA